MNLYKEYQIAFDANPFSEETSEISEHLVDSISEQRRQAWQILTEGTDVIHSSRKAWKTIKILSNDSTQGTHQYHRKPNRTTTDQEWPISKLILQKTQTET